MSGRGPDLLRGAAGERLPLRRVKITPMGSLILLYSVMRYGEVALHASRSAAASAALVPERKKE